MKLVDRQHSREKEEVMDVTNKPGTLQAPTGYDDYERFWAIEYRHGDRLVYDVNLTLASVPRFIPAPDPSRPVTGNRRVDVKHAAGIAAYLREESRGILPPIVLRSPSRTLEFEAREDISAGSGVRFGVLKVPKAKSEDLQIVDGQHRVLGLQIAMRQLTEEIAAARSREAEAKEAGNQALVNQFVTDAKLADEQRSRLSHERITVSVVIVDSEAEFKQIFVDMNDKARGVRKSERIDRDSRDPFYNAATKLTTHPLFEGKVEREKDTVGTNDSSYVTLANLLMILKASTFGITGRTSRDRQMKLAKDNSSLITETNGVLGRLLESFPYLRELQDGKISPQELREKSPLGRANTLRVLAGADWALRQLGISDEGIVKGFRELAPDFSGRFASGGRLNSASGSAFPENMMAPGSRNQNLKDAVSVIVGSVTSGSQDPESWLEVGKEKLLAIGARA
jgi:hypothetical protein